MQMPNLATLASTGPRAWTLHPWHALPTTSAAPSQQLGAQYLQEAVPTPSFPRCSMGTPHLCRLPSPSRAPPTGLISLSPRQDGPGPGACEDPVPLSTLAC